MRSVLVTGGTVRLGKVISERLRTFGWHVVTTSHRPESGADITVDLTRPSGVDELMHKLGEVDAVVNNAALFAGNAELVRRLDFEVPRRIIESLASRGKTAAVVNVIDASVLRAHAVVGRSAAYESAKRDLLSLTQSAALMYAPLLRINAVAPGPVLAPTDVHERAGTTPVGRPRPEDVADAVAFLLTNASVTGTVIPVDGGQHLV